MLRTMRRRKASPVTRISMQIPAAEHGHLRQVTDRPTMVVTPKGREIATSGECGRRRAHRRDVWSVSDLERPVPVERPVSPAHPYPVAVDPCHRLAPGIEPRRRGPERANRQVRRAGRRSTAAAAPAS